MILRGRIVTMVEGAPVLGDGCVYVRGGAIVAVLDASAPRPSGFSEERVVRVGGTLYPGLVELHNHLPYNVLPLWDVPRRFDNRGQWGRLPEYAAGITAPMGSATVPGIKNTVSALSTGPEVVGSPNGTKGEVWVASLISGSISPAVSSMERAANAAEALGTCASSRPIW